MPGTRQASGDRILANAVVSIRIKASLPFLSSLDVTVWLMTLSNQSRDSVLPHPFKPLLSSPVQAINMEVPQRILYAEERIVERENAVFKAVWIAKDDGRDVFSVVRGEGFSSVGSVGSDKTTGKTCDFPYFPTLPTLLFHPPPSRKNCHLP